LSSSAPARISTDEGTCEAIGEVDMPPRARRLFGFFSAVMCSGLSFAASPGNPVSYHLEPSRALSGYSSGQLALLSKLNRADRAHLGGLRAIIVPDRWDLPELLFSPLPQTMPELSGERKAIVVDLSSQVFGAYESGNLVHWGPVSTGDRRHQTPAGVYHLNWQSPLHVSSENPTWILRWYFNFESQRGMGVHQYSLPGVPASHGCIRTLAEDAKWLYRWGEAWKLGSGWDDVIQPGTLLLVQGSYNFKAPEPWFAAVRKVGIHPPLRVKSALPTDAPR
jgi:hypothetical protein